MFCGTITVGKGKATPNSPYPVSNIFVVLAMSFGVSLKTLPPLFMTRPLWRVHIKDAIPPLSVYKSELCVCVRERDTGEMTDFRNPPPSMVTTHIIDLIVRTVP